MNNTMILLAMIVACSLLISVALILAYQRLSRTLSTIKSQITKEHRNSYLQLESFIAIQYELGLPRALPRTRGWAASPDFLRVIMEQARKTRPTRVIECSSGISTVILARCMQLNGDGGHVFSLEHDAQYAAQTRSMLASQGLSDFATVIDAPLRPYKLPNWSGLWYDTAKLPADQIFDLLVVDGPPVATNDEARYPALPLLSSMMGAEAHLFLDDANRDQERAALRRWSEEFPDWQTAWTPKCEKGCASLRRGMPSKT